MNNDFLNALADLQKEKNISEDSIIAAIKDAVENAYRKNYGAGDIEVLVDKEHGEVSILLNKTVTEEVEDEAMQVSLEEAKSYDSSYELGDIVQYQIDPKDFGRIAAQGAKQVVVQKVREAERQSAYDEFIDKRGQIVTGKIERINRGTVLLAIGSTEGIIPASEQIKTEKLNINERIKVYVIDVKNENKGPQILLSRSHPGLIRGLLELEVPEISDGTVEITSIAREAGSRTKIAVKSNDENVDPQGACIGNRGTRIQGIMDELHGEKIDVVEWNADPAEFIANALRPAKVMGVFVDEDEKTATALVPEQQLSLAIGKDGQNVRLAARVTGWKIDIKSRSQLEESGFDFDEYEESDSIETAEL